MTERHQPLYLDLKYYREDAEKWFADTSIVEQLLQGLRKVGLRDSSEYTQATDTVSSGQLKAYGWNKFGRS